MNNFVLLNRTSFFLVYMTRNGLGFMLASAETYALQTLWSLAEIRWRHVYVTILLTTPSHNHDGYHHKPRFRIWQGFILQFYFSEKILSISKGQLYNIFKVSMQMAMLAHHHCWLHLQWSVLTAYIILVLCNPSQILKCGCWLSPPCLWWVACARLTNYTKN